jgi:hypothetical protein
VIFWLGSNKLILPGALLSKMMKGELIEKLPEWVAKLNGLMADGRHAVVHSHTLVDIP